MAAIIVILALLPSVSIIVGPLDLAPIQCQLIFGIFQASMLLLPSYKPTQSIQLQLVDLTVSGAPYRVCSTSILCDGTDKLTITLSSGAQDVNSWAFGLCAHVYHLQFLWPGEQHSFPQSFLSLALLGGTAISGVAFRRVLNSERLSVLSSSTTVSCPVHE